MTNVERRMIVKAMDKYGLGSSAVMDTFDAYMEIANELVPEGEDLAVKAGPVPEPPPFLGSARAKAPAQSSAPALALSLSSSLVSDEPIIETVDELYDRMAKGLPAGGQVTINGLGLIEVVTEPWKKFRELNSPTSDSAGFQVRLKNDRSVVIGKTMYFPGQVIDSKKDLHDILESYAHRNSADRGPVRSVLPPSVNPGDLGKSGMFAGEFAGGVQA